MRIATFLDVDGVLTQTPANMQLATLLGVQAELESLEIQFASNRINNNQFNARFVPLFRNAGFTESFADSSFDKIEMSLGFEQLLTGASDVFLVSSGPSFFVDRLAAKFGIPDDRVLCSRYEFDGSGSLLRCVRPVTGVMKGSFVKDHVARYDISIGVGDNLNQDTAFLSQCTIKVVIGETGNLEYLNVRELAPVVEMIQQLASGALRSDQVVAAYSAAVSNFHLQAGDDQNVFIMTPFRKGAEYRELISAVKTELEKCGLRGWVASDQRFHPELWDNVQIYMLGCRYGVAIFTSEDSIREPREKRGGERLVGSQPTYNPNVTIEVGYMLSRGKPVLLLVERQMEQVFSDIRGFLREPFDLSSPDESVRRAVRRWLVQLGLAPRGACA